MKPERMFSGWLPAMWEDQARYGKRFDEMTDVEGQVYIAQMALALHVEVSEFIEEFQWKCWKDKTDDFPVRNDRAKIAAEAVDVLHFLAHLLNAAMISELDLNWAMAAKREENERRQRSGYSY